eukprot:TRINITY_DN3515_c0_g1_i4.p1 TRINITY_DN3515_c0_g1~~TRINITY_DN3515_c0_g1_i4.p1  ORF type:complete len:265 (+),score=58.85 TRINITY_DN3515_c0_g1_i4:157-951(+)
MSKRKAEDTSPEKSKDKDTLEDNRKEVSSEGEKTPTRGRGRPKKILKEEGSADATSGLSTPKRGRGRPRKSTENAEKKEPKEETPKKEVTTGTADATSGSTPKRGRGRPKGSIKTSAPKPSTPKGKRGRPPKKPVPTSEKAEESESEEGEEDEEIESLSESSSDDIANFLEKCVASSAGKPKREIKWGNAGTGHKIADLSENVGFASSNQVLFDRVLQDVERDEPYLWKIIEHFYCNFDENKPLPDASKMLLLVICSKVVQVAD